MKKMSPKVWNEVPCINSANGRKQYEEEWKNFKAKVQ
jgi:hypothetical protein